MRVFNRSHVPWMIFVVLATMAAFWIYLGNFQPELLPTAYRVPSSLLQKSSEHRSIGGTPIGLVFGAISLSIFVFAALLGVRKKMVLWRIGNVQRWLRAHIWLTLLTIPLVILHSGFRLGGPMTTFLMVLYATVMISGIYGLVLQHQLPRMMEERLPAETVYEQIPHLRARLLAAASKMRDSLQSNPVAKTDPGTSAAVSTGAVTAGAEPETVLVEFLEQQVLPYLAARRGDKFRIGNSRYSEDLFRFVKLRVAEAYRGRVEEIEAWCDERRMLDLQLKLHHRLHGWLFVHGPLSFLLIMVTAWHAYVTLFYY
jgi:hypothetical protein